jgi:hypothetical protein
MNPPNSLRIVQFDDATRELMRELRDTLKGCRAMMDEVESELDNFHRFARFDITEEILDEEGTATFTFADLEQA